MGREPRYFGYYHGDGFPAGTPDHLDRLTTMGNSNVMLINSGHPPQRLRDMLDRIRASGCKFILSVSGCFFAGGTQGKIGSAELRDDWRERWNEYREIASEHESALLGFYFDEPYWNGVREEHFREATRWIRQQYPEKRVIACLTALELSPDAFGYPIAEVDRRYYEYVTDGAYDIYRKWDPFLYGYLNEKLKSKLAAEASIWYVVWGFTKETSDSSGSALAENLLNFYRLSLQEARCAGLLVFSYASGDAGDWGSGMDRLLDSGHRLYDPWLRSLHLNVGNAIINGFTDDLFVGSIDYGADSGHARAWRYEERDGSSVYRYLSAPGINGSQAIRVWSAPRAGTVYVMSGSEIRLIEASAGERLRIQIRKNGETIWPAGNRWQEVDGASRLSDIRLKLAVNKDDEILFIAGTAADGDCSKLLWWDPVISYDSQEEQ